MTRWLVCGGRNFDDADLMAREMERIALERGRPTLIIHGDARGADTLAKKWARRNGVATAPYPADWKAHGRAAGPIRNAKMIKEGHPGLVVAFPGGRGADDCVRQARAAGIEVIEVKP